MTDSLVLSRRRVLQLGAAGLGAAVLSACGGGDITLLPNVPAPTQNIVQLAQGVPSLSILVEAVIAANLATTLSSPGPFTVFAPTNDAFVALLGELGVTKAALLANTTLLTSVLTYHVLGARVLRNAIPLNTNIATVQGQNIRISAPAGTPIITDARGRTSNIVATNILATNGVVHVIDRVILPA